MRFIVGMVLVFLAWLPGGLAHAQPCGNAILMGDRIGLRPEVDALRALEVETETHLIRRSAPRFADLVPQAEAIAAALRKKLSAEHARYAHGPRCRARVPGAKRICLEAAERLAALLENLAVELYLKPQNDRLREDFARAARFCYADMDLPDIDTVLRRPGR